jgi:hypothetical protein
MGTPEPGPLIVGDYYSERASQLSEKLGKLCFRKGAPSEPALSVVEGRASKSLYCCHFEPLEPSIARRERARNLLF